MNVISRNSNVIFTSLVVGLLLLMVLPVPTFLLDILLALNIALAITILVVSLYMKQALDFSGFPAMLLVATLFRLTLNIASTRLILLNGANGQDAAGDVIATFGNFVVGGNYVVGIIVLLVTLGGGDGRGRGALRAVLLVRRHHVGAFAVAEELGDLFPREEELHDFLHEALGAASTTDEEEDEGDQKDDEDAAHARRDWYYQIQT